MKDHSLYSIIPYKNKLIKCFNPKQAYSYYLKYRINLLTNEKEKINIEYWIEEFKSITLEYTILSPRIIHLFYEFGFITEKLFEMIDEDQLLGIDIEYRSYEEFNLIEKGKIHLSQIANPDFFNYQNKFEKGYQELLLGNCYQFNLTSAFQYSFDSSVVASDFINKLWKNKSARGAFGSATFIPFFNKLFLSNSPECLFQLNDLELITMPIKGTIKYKEGDDKKNLWNKLISDKKNQAELFMITDLLRNDLSRIELPLAKVVKKKKLISVPGLIHQCSVISVQLRRVVTLWRVIEKIFPGGSITGAPKIRAMKLIHQLENRDRGFYCGSTMILFGPMKSASINIRAGVFDFNDHTLLYQAGGGITLESSALDEFNEMTYKCESFIDTLTL